VLTVLLRNFERFTPSLRTSVGVSDLGSGRSSGRPVTMAELRFRPLVLVFQQLLGASTARCRSCAESQGDEWMTLVRLRLVNGAASASKMMSVKPVQGV
jgi:hypothetical protein